MNWMVYDLDYRSSILTTANNKASTLLVHFEIRYGDLLLPLSRVLQLIALCLCACDTMYVLRDECLFFFRHRWKQRIFRYCLLAACWSSKGIRYKQMGLYSLSVIDKDLSSSRTCQHTVCVDRGLIIFHYSSWMSVSLDLLAAERTLFY